MIHVRQEEPRDYEGVYALITEAFATAEHSDGTEGEFGIAAPFPVEEGYYMALALTPEAEPIGGTVRYDPAFGI